MQVGTFGYMAPEVLTFTNNNEPPVAYSVAVDIWAIGVIAVELLLKRHPFSNLLDLAGYVHGIKSLDLTCRNGDVLTDACQDFLCQLLSASSDNRPTAEVAGRHSWIAEPLPLVYVEDS